jgi:hypothetical protein
MAEAADGARWNHTMAVVAQIYNANRGEGAEPIDPMGFYPWKLPEPAAAPPPTAEERAFLKQAFSGKK